MRKFIILRKFAIAIIFLIGLNSVHGQQKVTGLNLISDNKNGFVLAEESFAADILVDADDHNTVLLAADLFSDDVERITGRKPSIINESKSISGTCVIVGSLDESKFIQQLVKKKLIDVKEIEGEWESFVIEVIQNPLKGIEKALVIVGSDRRGTAYGLMELSRQMGVSPWYYFADVHPEKKESIFINQERFVQESPSVKYRGIFINDEMWGLRPWAMHTLAPEEGKGLGPTTYAKVFELLLRLKANAIWPAMHQQTRPFNVYEENKVVADKYGIVMGSSHIEPMLRNNIAGAEWDREYPGEPWDYIENRDHIYKYWEKRVKENGQYDNIYTLGKRGKDDVAGSDVNVKVLEQIFADQREILKKHVNKDVTKVPQVLIPYTEVLELYNEGLEVPEDIIICWPDDNFGNIRQLPNEEEQKRPGGSGIYYHFQWINGATSAYPWLFTSPIALTWLEMKKAYDYNARELWIVNVGDIKPAEIGIEHFMQMAWNIKDFEQNEPEKFLNDWAAREFGKEYAEQITEVLEKHFEMGYTRRPEHMVMFNGYDKTMKWDWFSLYNYNDEVQKRIDECDIMIQKVDEIYDALPVRLKDAFYQMVLYNVKGAALHNQKVLYAQKSNVYGQEKRSSAARYAALAQNAENEIFDMIHHYNKELITVGDKWDRMASIPGPWGGQWRQFEMPTLSMYSGAGYPELKISIEGGEMNTLPGFSVFNNDKRFIDLYNTGDGLIYWEANTSGDWIELSESSGEFFEETRIWVTIDWEKAPKGKDLQGQVFFNWNSSRDDIWIGYENLPEEIQAAYRDGTLSQTGKDDEIAVNLSVFNPSEPSVNNVKGFVESNGYISIEAEHFTGKNDTDFASWEVVEGLGRTGNSVTVMPFEIPQLNSVDEIVSKAPSLEYDIYTFTEGELQLELNCVPSMPVTSETDMSVAVSIDNEKPVIISGWASRDVISNLMILKTKLNIPDQGQHVLKIWMRSPGLVIDKIIIDAGGVKDSYLGPPESVKH